MKKKSPPKPKREEEPLATNVLPPAEKPETEDSEDRFDPEDDFQANRKLIRPDLTSYKPKPPSTFLQKKKSPPPENTNQENLFIASSKESKKLLLLKLTGGEIVRGWVEYYDRDCIKIKREKPPHLFIRKDSIVYIMYDEPGSGDIRKKRK
jgi:hypothetical protein